MNQKKKQNPFWHLAGPLLGYWVIQLVAEIIVSMLVMLPYAAKYLSLVMNHASEMNYTDVVNKYYKNMTNTNYVAPQFMDNKN